MEIAFDTRRFSGQKAQALFLTIDNGKTAEVRLLVRANSDDTALSQCLDFGTIRRGATPVRQMTVTFRSQPELRVAEAKCDSKFIAVELRELARGTMETIYQIGATVRADIPEGKLNVQVELLTNNRAIPHVLLPLWVEVKR